MRRPFFLCLSALALSIVAACASEDAPADAPENAPADVSEDAPADGSEDVAEASYTDIVGEIGGTLYDDHCPPGQLVVGLEGGAVAAGFYKGVLSKIRVLCGTPRLPDDGATEVTIGAGDVVPDEASARGSEEAEVARLTCPANEVVVGIGGDVITKSFPPEIDLPALVQFRCAKLLYTNAAVTVGEAKIYPVALGEPTGEYVGPFDCETGRVASGMRVQAGDILDAIAVRCEPVSIVR